MTIYQIEFKKYNSFYLFFNSERCVEEFLQNVKHKFHATSKKWFKCSFIIENTQNSIQQDLEPLSNPRYWSTETYDSIYYNDFIFYALKHDILKRVINNNVWQFLVF